MLVVLLDDAGLRRRRARSAVRAARRPPSGSPRAGSKFNRFHTTALCSPTRQALLTGRNHHAVGMGGDHRDRDLGARLQLGAAEHGRAAGRDAASSTATSTAQFGKCHEVPVWETSPMGPFDQWPTGSGFEYFYGFIGGETNQYYPALYEGTTPVEPPKTPEEGYHFTEDMTDKAIAWVRQQKSLMPDKPFFMYFAPGATHAPHHVPEGVVGQVQGPVRRGLGRAPRGDASRARRSSASIPADAELTARPAEIPAWDDMPDELKPVLARQMEVYAGFMEHTDHHVGRLVDALEELGILDDTLVYYIIGDNGASAEGTLERHVQRAVHRSTAPPSSRRRSRWPRTSTSSARPTAYNHYAVGWAHAMDTPYQWTKQVASHWGGTRNGTIVHWPNGIHGARRDALPVPPRHRRRRRPCSTSPGCPSRRSSTASSRCRCTA